MSLYKDASLVMIPSAVKDGRLYSIRPVEELGDEEVTNGTFDADSDWAKSSGVTISGGKANFVVTSGGYQYISQSITYTTGKEYILTADIVGTAGKACTFYDASGNNGGLTSTNGQVYFDGTSQRIQKRFTANSNSNTILVARNGSGDYTFNIDNVSVKEVLVNGDFTFSRGSNLAATRVDVNGLIEKGRENLLLQSNQFDTSWTLYNVTATSGQSGYDGGNNAWQISTTGVNGFENLNQNISFSGVHTISMYAKAGSNNYLTMRSLGTDIRVQFKLDDGTHSTTFGSPISTFMEDLGSGWYRCGFTANFSSASEWVFYPQRIGTTDAGNIYIQDAQLEQGLVATDYIETGASTAQAGILEDLPRLDYSGSCPALLLEPQRTNKITQSEYFQSGWVDNGNISYDFGYLAPDGTNSAYKITGNNNGYISFAGVLNNDTRSVYARTTSGTGTLQLLTYFGNTNNTFTITEEWQRFDISSVTTSTGELNFYLADFRGSTSLDEVILWGAQCEAGSYPTSYIPTYGSAVTRSLDSCLATSVSDVIGQTQGTFYWEGTLEENPSGANMQFALSDGTTSQQIKFVISSSSTYVAAEVKNGGVQQFYNNHNIDAKTNRKYAIAYNANDFAFYIDGTQIATDTSGSVPACSNLSFDNGVSANGIHGNFKSVILFPTRLTNAELAALTA